MADDDFFASDEFADEFDTDTGKPGIALVANAIQFWSIQNFDSGAGHCPTIRETAEAFKMTDGDVRRAVEHHYWMFVTGPDDNPTKQRIEHEGE